MLSLTLTTEHATWRSSTDGDRAELWGQRDYAASITRQQNGRYQIAVFPNVSRYADGASRYYGGYDCGEQFASREAAFDAVAVELVACGLLDPINWLSP